MTVAPDRADLQTIGAVLSLLQREFPDSDVTISKIRFLEAEGLVNPIRTPTGYRKFSEADVDRLRFTLRMQRDHFLPLRVIREQLDKVGGQAGDPDQVVPLRSVNDDDRPRLVDELAVADISESDGAELTLEDLASTSGLPMQDLVQLGRSGWLERSASGTGFAPEAAQIVSVIAQLQALGLDARALGVVKSSADKNVDLVMRLLGTELASKSADVDDITSRAGAISSLNLQLEALRIRGRLREELGSARH